MKLFHVQDDDRPLYVVAESYQAAHARWAEVIRAENDMELDEEPDFPLGISIVCGADDLLLPGHVGALI